MATTLTYAKAECDRCHVRRPKPEMISVRRWRFTGGSQRTYFGKYGNQTGRSVGSSKLTSKTIWRCRSCSKAGSPKWAIVFLIALLFGLWILGIKPNGTRDSAHNAVEQQADEFNQVRTLPGGVKPLSAKDLEAELGARLPQPGR